jgi:phage anti-repressor protein
LGYSNKYTLNPYDTNTSATRKNAWTNKCTPHFVFDETEFLNCTGSTPTGKKHHSNCPTNNAEKTQDYATIATTASYEQTKMATKISSLETDFTKHLKLVIKQSETSNKASQQYLEAAETLQVTQSKQILETFKAAQA